MKNKLEVIIKESGLEETKAGILLNNFQEYFKVAAEWEQKAKTIVVKDETQIEDMKMARIGRLFLREKRIAIEKVRKQLKEQSLREGKAIDGISNVLKALIVPIESYLDQQEHFVENKQKEEAEQRRIEVEKKTEENRLAQEEAERKEQERIKSENEKLKKEAEKEVRARLKREVEIEEQEREKEAKIKAVEDKAREEKELAEKAKKEAEEKAELEKKDIEDKAKEEREKLEKEKEAIVEKARLEQEKVEKDRKIAEEKAEEEKKRLQKELEKQVECPFCHKKFVPNKNN